MMKQIYEIRVRAGSTNSGPEKCGSNMYTEAFFGDSVGGRIIMLATFFVMLVILSMY